MWLEQMDMRPFTCFLYLSRDVMKVHCCMQIQLADNKLLENRMNKHWQQIEVTIFIPKISKVTTIATLSVLVTITVYIIITYGQFSSCMSVKLCSNNQVCTTSLPVVKLYVITFWPLSICPILVFLHHNFFKAFTQAQGYLQGYMSIYFSVLA